ncbi:MAG: hypothetical protein ACTHNW_22240, partial [Mucilaginibacter sp.]
CSDLEKHKKWGIFLFPEYQTDSLNQNISPIPSPILQRNLFLFKHTRSKKSSQTEGFFAALPFALSLCSAISQKIRQNLGLVFIPARAAHTPCLAKTPRPCSRS